MHVVAPAILQVQSPCPVALQVGSAVFEVAQSIQGCISSYAKGTRVLIRNLHACTNKL